MELIALYLILCVSALGSQLEIIRASGEAIDDEQNSEWEYEPRIWSVGGEETADQSQDSTNANHDELSDNYEEEVDDVGPELAQENPRTRHYYLERPEMGASTKQQDWSKCSQFRADTREAVVCDKNRCDKLTIEWPKFDNQLTVISSTRHGMRFHKTDYAFAASAKRNRDGLFGANERVKFDLLELFKPSTSTTTTTTTAKPANATEAPSTEAETATTDSEPVEVTTTTTTVTDNQQPATVNASTSNAFNMTQLVTTFRVSTSRRRQSILGFGGALSDSTCRNIKSLSAKMSKSLMEDYFGDRGIRYSLVRMSIGSSDFSASKYTNNDLEPAARGNETQFGARDGTKDDVEMNNFRLVDEDYDYKLPVARQAIATSRQEVKFFASLWSPPSWMKDNNDIVHGSLKGDIYGPYYKALAELMIKWLEAYRNNGIDFWGLTGLNEPVTGAKPFIHHNSLEISKEDYVTFIKLYLGPMLRRRGFASTQLMALDDNKGYAPFWVKSVLEDKEAAKYVAGVAFHWYMNDEYENLNFISKRHPDKFILATEACNGFLPFQVHALPGNWDRGVAYMLDIIKMLQKNSVGWVDWNMALNTVGGPSWVGNYLDAPVIVNAERDEYYKSPMFYAIGHFSAFVAPNSTRLDHRLANARFDYPLDAVAFLTADQEHVAIVALNANKHPVPFKIVVDRQLVRVVTLRADSYNTILFRWKSRKATKSQLN